MLGYTDHRTRENTKFGEYSTFAGEDILGRNETVDFFYKFWSALERPTRKDIRPQDLKAYLDHVVLMDVTKSREPFALEVRLIGTFVAHYYGEISGKDIYDMPNQKAAQRIYHTCNLAINQQIPMLTVTPGFDEGKQYLEAYGLYMPLFNEVGEVEKIMVCADIVSLRQGT